MIPLPKIREIAAARGHRQAIVTEDLILNWTEFGDKVARLVNTLHQVGDLSDVGSMCYISPNRLELVLMAAASATLKIPFVGLDYSQSTENLLHMAKAAECGLLVVSSSYCVEEGIDLQRLSEYAPVIDLDNTFQKAVSYQQLHGPDDESSGSVGERPFKAISFTSGTSGAPKAVLRNKSFDGRRFAYFTARYGFNAEDRHLLAMPMYHAAGSGWARLFLQLGATLVIAPPHNTQKMARMIRSEWITTSAMTPPLLGAIVNHGRYNNIEISPNHLRFVLVGGKHFPVQVKLAALQMLGPVIHEYYGTTETGVNTIAEPYDIMANPSSVGRPYDGNDIKVVDHANNPLPPGNIGRIAIASYMNMDGYKNSDSDKILIDGQRYLITAETGHLDEEGCLYLMNRSQGGSSLNLYDMENEINRLPEVMDVALVPSQSHASEVNCGLVLTERGKERAGDVLVKVKDILKGHKVKADQIGLLESIPYSPSGKVRAPQLLKLIEEAQDLKTSYRTGKEALEKPKEENKLVKFLVGITCLIGTAVAWGAMFPITKNALQTMDAVHITLVRYGLASIVFLIMLCAKEGWRSLWPGKQFPKLWLFGSFGFAGFSILAFAGLAHTKAQHGAIIMALMPLISVIMIWLLHGQRPKFFTIGCILSALLGVVLVVTQGQLSALTGGALLPSLVILSGAFCWVTYTLGAGYIKGFSTLRYTALSASCGTLTIIAIALLSNTMGWTTMPTLEVMSQVKWELAYLVIFAGVIAVFSWNTGIQTLGPINGVLFINLVPITAFMIGFLQGKEFTSAEITGAGITIAALLVNNLYARGWLSWRRSSQLQSKTV